jgi:hypothetical protein
VCGPGLQEADGVSEQFETSADAQLIDAVAEAVVTPPSREGRAAILNDLVQEIDEVVRWRHTEEADEEEVRSLEAVVTAASQHLERMNDDDGPAGVPIRERHLDPDPVEDLPQAG